MMQELKIIVYGYFDDDDRAYDMEESVADTIKQAFENAQPVIENVEFEYPEE